MTNAKKLVWMSRHSPTPRQLEELGRLFPGHSLTVDKRAFDSAAEIVARFRELGADELVVVAPWAVVRAIIAAGIRPIYAEMTQVPCDSPAAEVTLTGRNRRCYKFVRFVRCTDVALKLEPLYPPPTPTPDPTPENSGLSADGGSVIGAPSSTPQPKGDHPCSISKEHPNRQNVALKCIWKNPGTKFW